MNTFHSSPPFITLDSAAIGTIQAHANQQERLDEITERLARGEFHKAIAKNKAIPARCVDGRSPKDGKHPLAPNAAGGTESIFVADDLTTKRFAGEDGTTLVAYTKTIKILKEAGYEVGGHSDTQVKAPLSGCGANDKLPQIYDYIAHHGDTLRSVLDQLGVAVPDETHEIIIRHARERTQFSPSMALFAKLCDEAHGDFIDYLDGSHNEVVAVINKRPGTTLDRQAVKQAFGPDYQAFNVDVWAFAEAARATSLTTEETAQKEIAMLYYNLATTFVLAGPAMRIMTLD